MAGLWGSRYLGLDVLSKSRTVNDTPTEYEATPVEESRHELINHALGPDRPNFPHKPESKGWHRLQRGQKQGRSIYESHLKACFRGRYFPYPSSNRGIQ